MSFYMFLHGTDLNSTWVMDHFTMTFLAKTLNIVARYFTYGFWSGPTGASTSTQKVKESWDPRRKKKVVMQTVEIERKTSLRTTGSPGTAMCLRGMALSLGGSEPIQSALALPMPAGRVFMSEKRSVNKPPGDTALQMTDARALPTGQSCNRSSWNVDVGQNTQRIP